MTAQRYPLSQTLLTVLTLTMTVADPGVRFVHQEGVYMSYSSWILSFNVELKPYADQVTMLRDNILNFQYHINKTVTAPSTGPSDASLRLAHNNIMKLVYGEGNELRRHYYQLKTKFDELEKLVTSRHSIRKNKRSKRAILDLGNIMNTLFGTASQDQIDSISKGMRLLKDSQNKVITVLDHSVSVLNATNHKVYRNRQAINQVINQTQVLSRKIISNFNLIRNMNPEILFTEIVSEFTMWHNAIMRATDGLRADIDQFYELVTNAFKGTLSPGLISPELLTNALADVKRKIPTEVSLPLTFRTRKGLLTYYKILTTTILPDKGSFHLISILPLIHKSQKFSLISAISTPVYSPITNKTTEIELTHKHVAISPDKGKFILLKDKDIQACRETKINYCPVRNPIYQTSTTRSCLISLLYEQFDLSLKFCTRREVKANVFPVITELAQGQWLISTKHDIQATILCLGAQNETKRVIERGVQVLNVPPRCMMHSSYFSLPYYIRDAPKALVQIPPPKFDNWTYEFDFKTEINKAHDSNKFPVLNTTLTPIFSATLIPLVTYDTPTLTNEVDQLDNARQDIESIPFPNSDSNSVLPITFATFGPVVILVIVFLVILILFVKRRTKVQKEMVVMKALATQDPLLDATYNTKTDIIPNTSVPVQDIEIESIDEATC